MICKFCTYHQIAVQFWLQFGHFHQKCQIMTQYYTVSVGSYGFMSIYCQVYGKLFEAMFQLNSFGILYFLLRIHLLAKYNIYYVLALHPHILEACRWGRKLSTLSVSLLQKKYIDSATIQGYLGYCVTPPNYVHYPRIHRWVSVSRRAVGPRWHDDVAYTIVYIYDYKMCYF
jgi:hypothetical protein